MFQDTNMEYSTFWLMQNATLARSRKQLCMWSPGLSQNFSTSGYPKIRLQRDRESDDSLGCLALNRNFILSGLSKMRVGRSRESNVAGGRRELSTHFHVPAIPKYDFSEIEKATIQKGLCGTIQAFYSFWPMENAYLARSRKQCWKWQPGLTHTLETPGGSKIRLFQTSRKRRFGMLPFTIQAFYTFWAIQNATWTSSTKHCHKLSPGPSHKISPSGYPTSQFML